MQISFWAGLAWLIYVYAGYPVLLRITGWIRPFKTARQEGYCPPLSVLIAAHNEAKDIGWKVRETLASDYPAEDLQVLVASDASDDGTDRILAEIEDPRFIFVRMDRRGGKQRALNRLSELATGELLLFTDANTHIAASSARRMAGYFADDRVGIVSGVEQNAKEAHDTAVASGSRTYLGYEAWVNEAESRLGSVLVCDGSMFCMRRALFTPLDSDIANDLETPLRIGAAGFAILFDPALRSLERSTSSLGEEFARRRRICAQGLLGMWRLRKQLRGLRLWQFISRKFLRWTAALPIFVSGVSCACLAHMPFFAAMFIAECGLLLLALIGGIVCACGKSPAAILALPFYFLMVHFAAFLGVIDTLRGRRFGVWEQPSRSRGVHAITASEPAAGPAARH